jgi:uncharacterized protein (TIGR00730 family)
MTMLYDKPVKRVAIFCGSSTGNDPAIVNECMHLPKILHDNGMGIVYGGGNIGLMGIIADEMLQLNGEVIGVIPQKLVDVELAHNQLTQLHIVKTMHERKALMADISDAFIVLPGGIGTMDEFFEIFTWLQLGYHNKPIGICNINGYYNILLDFLKHMTDRHFFKLDQLQNLIIAPYSSEIVHQILKKK